MRIYTDCFYDAFFHSRVAHEEEGSTKCDPMRKIRGHAFAALSKQRWAWGAMWNCQGIVTIDQEQRNFTPS